MTGKATKKAYLRLVTSMEEIAVSLWGLAHNVATISKYLDHSEKLRGRFSSGAPV